MPQYITTNTQPIPGPFQQNMQGIAQFINKAMIAMDPLQSIPYMVMQQPGPQRWAENNPKTADFINTAIQLGVNRIGGGLQGAAIPWAGKTRIPQERLDQWINERNKLYHATMPDHVPGILKTGEIKPTVHTDPSVVSDVASLPPIFTKLSDEQKLLVPKLLKTKPTSEEYKILDARYQTITNSKKQIIEEYNSAKEKYLSGVSISRVPKASSYAYGGAPITFELDPAKMPPSRPFAELGWGKTRLKTQETGNVTNKFYGETNPRFEFENRTYNQPITTTAITKAMVDRSLLGSGNTDELFTLFKTLRENNIPVHDYINSRAMHSYRARIGADVKRKLLEKAFGAGQ